MSPGAVYRFGTFELITSRFELRRNGCVVKLERIPMDLLVLLAERNGEVVTRPEIVDRLWGKEIFVDTEHGINTAVRKIRAALGEDAERPGFVQTVPGRGYRLAIDRIDPLPERADVPPAEEPIAPKLLHRRPALALAAAAIVVLTAAAVLIHLQSVRGRTPAPGCELSRCQTIRRSGYSRHESCHT